MHRIVEANALADYRIELRYADGTRGIVDLSDLVGKGVFSLWTDYEAFRQVSIGSSGELVWGDHVDLCADSLYMRLTGKNPEEVFPRLKRVPARA